MSKLYLLVALITMILSIIFTEEALWFYIATFASVILSRIEYLISKIDKK